MPNELISNQDGLSRTTGQEVFAADLVPERHAIWRIMVSGSLAHVLEVSVNSGTDWTKLNSGAELVADQLYTFDIQVLDGDTFQMRQSTGTVVFDILRIIKVD